MSSSPTAVSAIAHSDRVSSPLSSSPPKQISPVPRTRSNQTQGTSPNKTVQNRPLSDIIGETFPPFDHQACIVTPFNNELNRDAAFERELSSMLLDAIIETHAWASTRPKHESSLAAQSIEQKIVSVMETEKEQDKTRQQLNHFVTQIKTALAALTGVIGV
ncbi:hypothetical protein LshimejAT787_1103670 [Lyophyllum shimeji]|uniref:Uncharacterized protein n=1 Tax=Lyophyllum shimeji TaxID=47721 RepID=A0A9P3PT62_LYOSH|nr:hypothetical protein LshimejAT787_1103670 [Lyophyllum shimeji]